jgi:hypothetical protein
LRLTRNARDGCNQKVGRSDDPAKFRMTIRGYERVPVFPLESCEDKGHLECLHEVVSRSGIAKQLTTRGQKDVSGPPRSKRTRLNHGKVALLFRAIGKQVVNADGLTLVHCQTGQIRNDRGNPHGVIIAFLGNSVTKERPQKVVGYYFGLKALVHRVGTST